MISTSLFPKKAIITLIRSAIVPNTPVYVQFYLTARCNLTCKQCNIRYANADLPECNLTEIARIAENLAKINVAIVLLTGGEPFARVDLPEIIHEFVSRGIHVRMQTNGLASEEKIHKAVEYGGNDISISLDSLVPKTQEEINGGFPGSWHRALRSIALFTKYLSKSKSFASFGCVLQKQNIDDIIKVIHFGTRIGWYTSLVPIHISDNLHPRAFMTYDQRLKFEKNDFQKIDKLIEHIRVMRNNGYLLYDSDQYLDDVKRFVKGQPITWRKKNNDVCDSPNLYFAILPNGDLAPCCDYRMKKQNYSTISSDFPRYYKDRIFLKEVFAITSACSGCMYGSFPEMTISMRFQSVKWQRVRTFFTHSSTKPWPLTYEQILNTATEVENMDLKRALRIYA